MRFIWRSLRRVFLGLFLALLLYVLYGSWAWRDIPVAELEQRYGTPDLQQLRVDGVPVRYQLHRAKAPSEPDTPTLVLIHSHFFDMGMWDSWVLTLQDEFTLLRYDLSGHGLTGPDPSGVYTVERDVELLHGLLTQLEMDSLVLVGSSLGGNIAFHYAAQYPEHVRALTLINSGGLKRPRRKRRGEIPGWADAVFPLLPPVALHRFVRWMVADDTRIDEATLARFVHMWRRHGNRPAELERLRQFRRADAEALLAQVTAPTLILWGESNPQLPVAMVEEFQQKLVKAEKVRTQRYAGVGHVIPLEAGPQSAQDTASFVRSLATRATSAPGVRP